MKTISGISLKFSGILVICALITLLNPLWISEVEYNDVGPAFLTLLALLAWGLTLGVPVCAIPVAILSVVAIARDEKRIFGIIALLLCISAYGIVIAGKQIEERKKSQQSTAQLFFKSALLKKV